MTEPNMGPPKLGPSIDDEAKELRKGRWPILVGVGLLFAAALAAAVVWLGRSDGSGTGDYRTVGQQINAMKSEHFDGFWACALPRARLSDLHNDQDLRYNIHKRASSSPTLYARHVRDECLVKLNEHEPPLHALIAPPDLHNQLNQLTASIDEQRTGWTEYLTELDRLAGTPYEQNAMNPHLNKLAKGWFDYRVAYGALNKSIRDHIQ